MPWRAIVRVIELFRKRHFNLADFVFVLVCRMGRIADKPLVRGRGS